MTAIGRKQTLIKLKPGVIQKPLATCFRKALSLEVSGIMERGVRKQMISVGLLRIKAETDFEHNFLFVDYNPKVDPTPTVL